MKRINLICVLLLGLPTFIFSQNINGRFSSSIYTFERFDTTDVSSTYIRSYQMLNLNVNQGNYSFRSFLNLESDLSKKMDYDPRLRFYNLYLEGRNIFDIATIKLGRQPLFNSIAGGVFDGVNLDLKYKVVKLTGYYGGNVPAYQKLEITDKWKDDYIYGGKLSTTALPDFLIAVSFINKNFRPIDFTPNGVNTDPLKQQIERNSNQYKFVSGEVSYEMKNIFDIETRYDYDLNFEKTSKFEASGRYEQIENLGISLYYNYREPRVRYNSIFSVFDYGNSQEMEAGADYRINKFFTVDGRFGYVKYKDDNSKRFSVGVNSSFGGLSYRKTLGYAGELDAVSLYAAHSFMEGFITPSLGLTYSTYKLSKEDTDKNSLTSILAGLNVRPWTVLSFDAQGQFMNNKLYKNDFRFLFKINYWFNTNL
ncbi:MAG: hypothetical protein ACM3MI_09815 [Clostridiales bacterium]